jgi:hypothetical protein
VSVVVREEGIESEGEESVESAESGGDGPPDLSVEAGSEGGSESEKAVHVEDDGTLMRAVRSVV